MNQTRAMSPADAFWTLDPFALVNPDDPWHAELENRFEGLRYGVIRQLVPRLTPAPSAPDYVHLGIVGHKGTGKTTGRRMRGRPDRTRPGRPHRPRGRRIRTGQPWPDGPKLSDRRQVDAAVLRRADDLRRLRCHLVLFFDPADQYAPATVQAGQAFDVLTLPMLPIRTRTDSPEHVDEHALAAIHDLVGRRVELESVFHDPDACLRQTARLSGGRLRDVFHLTRLACELADPKLVEVRHLDSAARRLAGERMTLAKPEHWQRLAEIHRDKQVANAESDALLLLHSLVLNYNGEPWWDIHPLVRLDSRFDEAWQNLSRLAPSA